MNIKTIVNDCDNSNKSNKKTFTDSVELVNSYSPFATLSKRAFKLTLNFWSNLSELVMFVTASTSESIVILTKKIGFLMFFVNTM